MLRAEDHPSPRNTKATMSGRSVSSKSNFIDPCYEIQQHEKQKPRTRFTPAGAFVFNSGNVLLSHTLARAVPSGLQGLTSVFGMGTGGTPALQSPKSDYDEKS